VINRTEALACKHVLAVRLAEALLRCWIQSLLSGSDFSDPSNPRRYNRIEVEDAEFSEYLIRDDRDHLAGASHAQ
jgi:hypothetical protein